MPDQPEIIDRPSLANTARAADVAEDADSGHVPAVDPARADARRSRIVVADQPDGAEEAVARLRAAECANPTDPVWPARLGAVLMQLGRHADAVITYDRAIALAPAEAAWRQSRSAALLADDRAEEALAALDDAIALRPDAVESHIARGAALEWLHRHDEAMAAYDDAIAIDEACADAWHAKGQILLLKGQFKEGWALFEWRWFRPNYREPRRLYAQDFWDGTPLRGRTLLVHPEQGLGDAIQCYRFVALARRQGPVVTMVSSKLALLFASQPDAPMIVSDSDPLPSFDVHCPMMSLPFLLGTELHTLPETPYLRADPTLAFAWREALPPAVAERPRVGIVWAGSHSHRKDRYRSMPLRTMLGMLVPEVTVVSLQKDIPDRDRVTLLDATHVLDLSEGLANFADTAAVISQLDLVITVDTAVAHLAGAMDVPVWVLLSTVPDWRWLDEPDDTRWYRSARLFRQDRPGDWEGVAQRVRDALAAMGARS